MSAECGVRSAELLARLSAAQRVVLTRIAQGRPRKQIAQELQISLQGVQFHVRRIYTCLNVQTTAEAAAWAARLGLV